MESQESVITIIKLAFTLLIVVAMVLFVVVPLIRHWRNRPDMDLLVPTYDLEDDPQEEELQIPTGVGSMPDRAGLLDMAREDPQRTAMLVAKWIRDKS